MGFHSNTPPGPSHTFSRIRSGAVKHGAAAVHIVEEWRRNQPYVESFVQPDGQLRKYLLVGRRHQQIFRFGEKELHADVAFEHEALWHNDPDPCVPPEERQTLHTVLEIKPKIGNNSEEILGQYHSMQSCLGRWAMAQNGEAIKAGQTWPVVVSAVLVVGKDEIPGNEDYGLPLLRRMLSEEDEVYVWNGRALWKIDSDPNSAPVRMTPPFGILPGMQTPLLLPRQPE